MKLKPNKADLCLLLLPLLLAAVTCSRAEVAVSDSGVGKVAVTAEAAKKPVKKPKKTKNDPALTDPLLQGKSILENRCSTCHVAPKPEEHAASEWPAILNRMGPRAFLRQSDMQQIQAYIDSRLKAKTSSQ